MNLCECDDDDEQLEVLRCFGIVKWVRVVGEYHAIVLNIVEKYVYSLKINVYLNIVRTCIVIEMIVYCLMLLSIV